MPRLSMADRLKKSGTATVARLDDARAKLKNQSNITPTKEQSNGQTDGHSNGQTDTLADTLADTVTDTLADTQKNIHSITPADSLEHTQVSTPEDTLRSTPKDTLADSLKDIQKNTRAATPHTPDNDAYFWMTPGQAKILLTISRLSSGKTQLNDLTVKTGVPYGTVRKALVALHNQNCITKPKKIRIGQWQGLHIELLEEGRKWVTLRDSLKDRLPDTLESTHRDTLRNTPADSLLNTLSTTLKSTLLDGHSGGHSKEQSLINSSSSLLNKTTTITPIHKLESRPELGYWLQKGLKQKQIATWAQEFQISEEDVIESLCFCRFDMIDNDRENKDQIKDVFAWFYKIVKRAGAYPKPNNYKSHQDKLIERERRRTEERKKQVEELRKARQEAVKAQYELEFEQMLQDPESPTHQKCRETLPALLKKPNKAGSIAFVAAMKNAFCKLNDIEDC